MTRQRKVDPEFLCHYDDHENRETDYSHLMGEHAELHMVIGSIRDHPHGIAIVEGHAEKGQINTALIQERHDALVAEMERRGIDHDTPMDYDDELDLGVIDTTLDPNIEQDSNLQQLMDECPACRERIWRLR